MKHEPYRIEETTTRKGFQNIILHINNKSISLHSLNPLKECERIVSKINTQTEWTLVAGVGLGYLPDFLLENTHQELILFEDIPEILQKVTSKWENNPRIHLFSDIDQLLGFISQSSINEMNLYFHRPYVQAFPSTYNKLEGQLTAMLSKRKVNQATLYRFQKTWLTNLVKNSRFFHQTPGIAKVRGIYQNMPAVIAGAGPSLRKSIPVLKTHRDRFILIAVDTALLPLQTAGIQPDWVVTMDPQDKNAQYLLYANDQQFNLLMDASGHSLLFEKFQGKNLYMSDSIFPVYQQLVSVWGEKTHLKSGGSVSTTAFSLSVHLGCSPLILTGQDMAFSYKQIHANGTILEKMLYYRINKFNSYEQYHASTLLFADSVEIQGWDKKTVKTDRKFLIYLKWFENEIQSTNIQVYQTSEGGAFVQGAKHQKLAEILSSLAPLHMPGLPQGQEVHPQSLAKLRGIYHDILKEIEFLLPLMTAQLKILKSLQKAFAQKQQSRISALLQQLNTNDQKFLRRIQKKGLSSKFVELTMQKTIQEILNTASTSGLDQKLIQTWQKLYSDFAEGLLYSRYRLSKTISLMKEG